MRNEWRKSNSMLLGYKCIECKYNQELPGNPAYYEKCLAGKYGEIWVNNEKTFKCVITKHHIKRKLIDSLQLDVSIGKKDDELVLTLDNKHIALVTKLIKLPKNNGRQVTYANET